MDISEKIQSASHSGAQLQVIRDGKHYLVQKTITTSLDKNYLGVEKQCCFTPLPTPTYTIQAIPITHLIREEKLLSITMPYIEGLGGERMAYRGSKTVARNLKTALDFYLLNSVALSEDNIYPVDAIHLKLNEIEQKLKGNFHLFPELGQQITEFRAYCRQDLQMPMGSCHGDLTLANLKITEDNQLYLFDFLSCEIDSPLQDAAKIVQDFEYGWSFRKEKESIRIKGEIFCQHAYPNFLTTLNRLFNYEMRVIEVLTLLRIAPYINSQDSITIRWFNDVMAKSMNKLAR
ncbi:phosphotransferase [Vibrio fujianensis]|uniref:phosphotransferase n=1 Tax=Vibrio fujianensis TaxID=1974215 RepID=UPI000C17269C|nr:phosphotransferase [Vibrio fujianensis]